MTSDGRGTGSRRGTSPERSRAVGPDNQRRRRSPIGCLVVGWGSDPSYSTSLAASIGCKATFRFHSLPNLLLLIVIVILIAIVNLSAAAGGHRTESHSPLKTGRAAGCSRRPVCGMVLQGVGWLFWCYFCFFLLLLLLLLLVIIIVFVIVVVNVLRFRLRRPTSILAQTRERRLHPTGQLALLP
jgi:hypothetical protein